MINIFAYKFYWLDCDINQAVHMLYGTFCTTDICKVQISVVPVPVQHLIGISVFYLKL